MSAALVSHVGIAVADLEEAVERYRLLTGREPTMHEVAEQQVRVAMFAGAERGEANIELLAATSADSPIAIYLKKHREGLHHICLFVEDLDRKLKELQDAGVQLVDRSPRIGAGGNRIAFVHPSGGNGVLIEFEEKTG